MSCCDDCECQGIPRLTIWSETTPGVSVVDAYLMNRRKFPIVAEQWGGDDLQILGGYRYSHTIPDDSLLLEWSYDTATATQILVSTIDADRHILSRHEFKPLRSNGESSGYLYFDMSIEQGAGPDEFVVTFSGWNVALPLPTIAVSNNRPAEIPPTVLETLTQTSSHVWTFTRATDPIYSVTTFFQIGGAFVSINESDTLVTLQDRFAKTKAFEHVIGDDCEALRRDVFAFEATYGTNTDFDPVPVFVQLDMTEKRAPPIATTTHVPSRPFLMIEADPSSGLHFGSIHSISAAIATESSADENVWAYSAYPLSDDEYNAGGTNVVNQVFVRKCNNRWSLETRRGTGGTYLYDLWLPVAADPAGDRPETIVFEWSRPFSPSGPADDGSRPDKDAPNTFPSWDLSGKRFNVYVMASPEALGIFGYTFIDRALALHSEGWTGTNATLLNCDLDRLADHTSISTEDPDIDKASFVLGIQNGEAPTVVKFTLVGWTGGYTQTEIDPHVWSHYNRRVELIVETGASRVVFVPSPGPLPVIDEFFDAPINWIYDRSDPDVTSSAQNATITTNLSRTIPGDCPDYEDYGSESPFVFSVKYKNDTLLLPRTGPAKWSRILTVDGESLAFCLEHHIAWYESFAGGLSNRGDAGWRLTVYTADSTSLPWRTVYQFLPGNTSEESELGEWPPFGNWKPYEENELGMIWHRDHDDSLPATVTATGLVPASHPAGTSRWVWNESTRDWDMTHDNSSEDHAPKKPPTRASANGAIRRTVSGVEISETVGGAVPTNWVAWWSPDGIAWLPIVDGCNVITELWPDAPTHTPAFAGDSYRAFCTEPPPPPPSGDCLWQWDGAAWQNVSDDCGVGLRCDPPVADGTVVDELQNGSCSLVDCGGKKATYLWIGGFAPAGWILAASDCPAHCVPPGGPNFPGTHLGEFVYVDCECIGCP